MTSSNGDTPPLNGSISTNNTNVPVIHSERRPRTILQSLKIIITTSWINVLLIFIPFGYLAEGLKWGDTVIFVLNFLAIVQLAKLLGFATEDISLRVNQLKSHSHLFHEEWQGEPKLSLGVSLFLFVAVTVAVAFSAKYLVDSIEGVVESSGLSKTFIGVFPLPILCNSVELINAFTASINNRMNLDINVDAGSYMQIILFVTPFLGVLGWIVGLETTLIFQSLETVVLFISFLIANYLIQRHNLRKFQKKFWKRRF